MIFLVRFRLHHPLVMPPPERNNDPPDDEVEEIEAQTDSNENENVSQETSTAGVSILDSKKRKREGEVWNCLTPLKEGGGKCNFCEKVFPMKQGSTSNANRHLLAAHFKEEAVKSLEKALKDKQEVKKVKIELQKKKLASQPSLTSMIIRKGPIDKTKSSKIDAAVIKWIVKSNKAFNVVEDSDFRRMMSGMMLTCLTHCRTRQQYLLRLDSDDHATRLPTTKRTDLARSSDMLPL